MVREKVCAAWADAGRAAASLFVVYFLWEGRQKDTGGSAAASGTQPVQWEGSELFYLWDSSRGSNSTKSTSVTQAWGGNDETGLSPFVSRQPDVGNVTVHKPGQQSNQKKVFHFCSLPCKVHAEGERGARFNISPHIHEHTSLFRAWVMQVQVSWAISSLNPMQDGQIQKLSLTHTHTQKHECCICVNMAPL